MKKILFSLIVLLALVSCEKEAEDTKFTIDPNATILIRPAKTAGTRAVISDLTNLEIVENANGILWQSNWFGNTLWNDVKNIGRSFIPEHKDVENQILKMWATDVIDQQGDYYKDFTYGFNVFIIDGNNDTIAYVPDEVISSARIEIEKAYDEGDYEKVYDLFNTAFTFLPIESK